MISADPQVKSSVPYDCPHFFFSFFFCGILVPPQGTEPGPMAVKVQSPNHWITREFPVPTSDASHKSQVITCNSDQLALNWGFPCPPSFRLDSLPGELTDLRKELSLLLLVYFTGYNTGTAKWKRYGNVCQRGYEASLPSLGMPPSQHLEALQTNPEALRTLSFKGFNGGCITEA